MNCDNGTLYHLAQDYELGQFVEPKDNNRTRERLFEEYNYEDS